MNKKNTKIVLENVEVLDDYFRGKLVGCVLGYIQAMELSKKSIISAYYSPISTDAFDDEDIYDDSEPLYGYEPKKELAQKLNVEFGYKAPVLQEM